MLNLDTIQFIKLMDELAHKTLVGFKPFKEFDGIFGGVVYADEDDIGSRADAVNRVIPGKYVVRDALLDACHHDVLSVYGDELTNYVMRVILDDGAPYIRVTFVDEDGGIIRQPEAIVEHGHWYMG